MKRINTNVTYVSRNPDARLQGDLLRIPHTNMFNEAGNLKGARR